MLVSVCFRKEDYMGENIFVIVLCVIALAAGIWGWWIDNKR
ncbi:MAG: hypothetical protein UFJ18_09320 [Blautia sp.]|nr:hypothetical protein [Eubacteriales bacterium]MDO5363295.1 hypothetical protein [Eubacteriales bacterium]MED9966976.1 hypothetical protein [Blautia sp.]